MTMNYRIADHVFLVDSKYSSVHELCKEYISAEEAEFEIHTSQFDIDLEREKSRSSNLKNGTPVRNFSDEYLETLAVYRKVASILVDSGIMLFHGSVVSVDEAGYLFTAKSGTGKSTHTSLWREYFGNRAIMINDDKPLIKIADDEIRVYGTPWDGKHRLSTNTSVPLKAICILERDKENQIERMSGDECLDMLIQQSFRPSDPVRLEKSLKLVYSLAERVSLFRMKCNMDISAAETAYNGMK